MYTGKYEDRDDGLNIPEGYDGNAFGREEELHSGAAPTGAEPRADADTTERRGGGILSSIFRTVPFELFGGGDKGIPGLRAPRDIRIGKEEIIIIAIALFLFISKEGDITLSLMLLSLLFI